jgi:hypothetical protein
MVKSAQHIPLYTSFLLTAACSSDFEIDPSIDEQSYSLEEHANCVLPSGRRLVALELAKVSSDAVTIVVHNNHTEDATITLSTKTFGDFEEKSAALRDLKLAGKAESTLTISKSELFLLRRQSVDYGRIFITASAEFIDGRRDSDLLDPVFYSLRGQQPALSATREQIATGPDAAFQSVASGTRLDVDQERLPSERVAPAAIVTKRLCFRQVSVSLDANVGEDIFASTSAQARTSMGQQFIITQGSPAFIQFWSGDGFSGTAGCSPSRQWQTGSAAVTAYAGGIVSGHPVGSSGSYSFSINISSSTGDQWFDFDPTASIHKDEMNIFAILAYGIVNRGTSGTQPLNFVANAGSGSSYTGDINIAGGGGEGPGDTGDAREKFTVTHELGHWLLDVNADQPSVDYSITGSGSCTSTSTSHGLGAIEYQSAAMSEGFASFFAGLVYNNPSQNDCFVNLAEGTVVNCDVASTGLPVPVMETNCATPYAGLGVETDWHRTFWDMAKGNSPSLTTMMSWIDTANNSTPWSNTNIYSLLNTRANGVGGTLNTDWDAASAANGIDY